MHFVVDHKEIIQDIVHIDLYMLFYDLNIDYIIIIIVITLLFSYSLAKITVFSYKHQQNSLSF